MIEAGKLRHRITIQSPTNTQDPNTGSVTVTWTELAKVWASVEPLSAREFLQSQADQSEVTARITIRYRSDLTADMRILFRSKTYNPAGFLPDKISGLEYITIPCSEGVSDSGL